ncbi:helix-turn-helix domain-containing protein [Jiangella alkaliphila]|uniref:DNA-binding transcriptional regulator, XRE-family HTH domain n=1 Tax=Jiangella alkaliphila TaxID=419479 RepID=A0A1H2GD91_9ACTN|nr:helix-turn-helix transcriptional regulator [Jiangella alkaliphila]SDU17358.1 DNA-binding transcriptional regulator, XRE-family HTH domain [Jiangella alkaliphila]
MDDVDSRAVAAIRGRLRALRQRRRLTLAQVQAALDGRFTISSIGAWERGDRVPSLDTIVTLARFYGVTVGYMVAGEGDGPVVRAASAEIRSAAVGLLIAARLHPDLDPSARAALTTALRAGVALSDLALDTGRPGLELARLIEDPQLRLRALHDHLDDVRDYIARLRVAVKAVTPASTLPTPRRMGHRLAGQ